ncbi:MAG: M24 family metallopeptidase, partial [Acidobacteria bacterium]|nr:M24 family metallopeptidase [Acidobacteriota bacterium]
VHGYHSDVSRTFAFGKAPDRFQQVYGIVKAAQEAGFRAARPGTSAGAVDEAARYVIRKAGFAKDFTHRLGHGLGLEVHEQPYLVAGNSLLLEEGMTVTIEPGIYLSGEFGIRLEDDVRISLMGADILSSDSPIPPPTQIPD